MSFLSVVATILLVTTNVSFATDYCDEEQCGDSHIACDNDGAFSPRCQNPQEMQMTAQLKKVILDSHNEKRNYIAGGYYRPLRPACRMATMQWDEELAALASYNVKKCQMEHDCHNTATFKYSGQNLAWRTFYGAAEYSRLVRLSIDMWYDEKKDTRMSHIRKYPTFYYGPTIGHFTVMVAEKNIRVGCAASTYSMGRSSSRAFLFACNYATTNMVNFPIYEDCSRAGTKCETGKNPNYKNLCSASEEYDVNAWF